MYKETHYKTPIGAAFFGYYNSYAYSLRGNNSAAIREIGVCIDSLEARWLQTEPLHLSLLANITMMLWHVNLNIKENNIAVGMMWNRIAALWHESNTDSSPGGIQYRTSFEEICCSIAYTVAASKEGGIPASTNIPLHLLEYENLNSASADSQNYFKKVNSSHVVDNRDYVAPTEDASAAEGMKRNMWDIFSSFGSNSEKKLTEVEGNSSGVEDRQTKTLRTIPVEELKSLLLQQEANMQQYCGCEKQPLGLALGSVEEYLQTPSLSFTNPRNIEGTVTDKQQMIYNLGVPLCTAIKHMCVGEYKEAALILLKVQGLFGSSLGASILHTNIIETTLIEA